MDYLKMFKESILKEDSIFNSNKNPQVLISNVENIVQQFRNHEIPVRYDNDIMEDNFSNYFLRQEIIKYQGFALLTQEWINDFAEWIADKKCLEIMCGCGALSKILKDKNIDIIATDNFSWDASEANWNINKNYWTEIEDIDCIEAIEKYKDRDVIIMSWAYMDDTAYRCLLKMREVNPNMVMVVIGESYGGCTADDNFFESITEIEDENIYNIDRKIPRWDGIHDHMMLVK